MRTTINLDEQLLIEAQRVTGMKERTALIHEGLRALSSKRESARRLARLGGSEPQLRPIRGGGPSTLDPRRHIGLDRPSAARDTGARCGPGPGPES